MGCHTSKTPKEAAHQVPLSPMHPVPPTLLNQRAVDLPPVEVQIVKQDNAQRAVFTSPVEHRSIPVETSNVSLNSLNLDHGSNMVSEKRSEQSDTLYSDQRSTEALVQPELIEAPNQDRLSGSKQPTTSGGNIGHQLAVKLPSACCEPRERRKQKDALCGWDCCEEKCVSRSDSSTTCKRKRRKGGEPGKQLESLMQELFRAHDLNGDGMLDEMELIRLNEAVAEVHNGNSSGSADVHRKYSDLFREKFDPDGNPVPYSTFRAYMLEMLDGIDRHEDAQEMIVEQFLAEARLARTVVTGAPLLSDRRNPQDCCNTACYRFCPASEAATEVRAY